MVPPIQRERRTREDQSEMKASVPPRLDMAKIEMRTWRIAMPRMKYLSENYGGIVST